MFICHHLHEPFLAFPFFTPRFTSLYPSVEVAPLSLFSHSSLHLSCGSCDFFVENQIYHIIIFMYLVFNKKITHHTKKEERMAHIQRNKVNQQRMSLRKPRTWTYQTDLKQLLNVLNELNENMDKSKNILWIYK